MNSRWNEAPSHKDGIEARRADVPSAIRHSIVCLLCAADFAFGLMRPMRFIPTNFKGYFNNPRYLHANGGLFSAFPKTLFQQIF
jgi:hypothetical protein